MNLILPEQYTEPTVFQPGTPLHKVVTDAKRRAAAGWYESTEETWPYALRGMTLWRGAKIMLTRDRGMHSSGWWKNPDYEKCLHLSMSFFDVETGEPTPHDRRQAGIICRAVFRPNTNLLWIEPPMSEDGKILDTWHYRLFVDAGGQPIKPRGEVYSREHTPAGWLSWSDWNAAGRPQQ